MALKEEDQKSNSKIDSTKTSTVASAVLKSKKSNESDDNDILITTKKGNKLTKGEWKAIETSGKNLYPKDPKGYMNWVDNWAKPDPINAAAVAAKEFQKSAANKKYEDSPATEVKKVRKVNIPFSGHWKDEEYTAIEPGTTGAQKRAADSTQFVNKYYKENEIDTPNLSVGQKIKLMKQMAQDKISDAAKAAAEKAAAEKAKKEAIASKPTKISQPATKKPAVVTPKKTIGGAIQKTKTNK